MVNLGGTTPRTSVNYQPYNDILTGHGVLPKPLEETKVLTLLSDVPGWEMQTKALERKFFFPSFAAAMAFVNLVAELAEDMDHHPDISINYRSVTLRSWSHDSAGITMRDFKLAVGVNGISRDHI